MQFGTTVAIAPSITRVVEAASPDTMQRLITQALAEIAAAEVTLDGTTLRFFVTDMTLAGAGDGHTFVCTITASAGAFQNPLDPAQTSVQCFMASQAEALAKVAVQARNRVTPGDFAVGFLEAGASGGTRFMGVLITAAAADSGGFLGTPTNYFYQEQISSVVIAAADTPVAVPGTYSFQNLTPVPLFTEVSPGILEYTGQRFFNALVRTRVSVRGDTGSGGPLTVLSGPVRAVGGTLASIFITAQSIDVLEAAGGGTFKQVTCEASMTFSPTDDGKQVALGIANGTDDGDLQVQSAMMTIEPL